MTFPRSAPVLGLGLALVAGACASTPDTAPHDVAGCYYFEQDATARDLNLPWGVRLTTDSLTGWPPLENQPETYRAVTLVDADRTSNIPFGYWRNLPGDSVRIGYPGMGGFSLALARNDRDLTGLAHPVGDAGLEPRRSHPVRLQWARCPGN